ncbi:MAG: lasso peptide biosynthesis B2 protein [Candidatus Helarchaeota archaeon]|nr:lasso peptide biosynthesis B2 protein [Candidatus Helarchaeota archaeon]
MPLISLQRVLKVFSPQSDLNNQKSIPVDHIAWAVKMASSFGFRATCLVQALATQVLLAGEGISSVLHIGVMKGKNSSFEAHAWVESEGRIIIGGSDLIPYKKLASLQYELK